MLRRGRLSHEGGPVVANAWIALAVSRHGGATWSAVVRVPATARLAIGDRIMLEFDDGEHRGGAIALTRRDRSEQMVMIESGAAEHPYGIDRMSAATRNASSGGEIGLMR